MSLYKVPGSDVWHASISIPGRPRLRCTTGQVDRVAAQKAHDGLKAEAWKLPPVLKGWTWGKAVDLWCKAEERSESELLSLRKLGKLYPDRLLVDVTAESIEEALAFCQTAGTYTRYRTMIMAILNLAKGRDWIDKLPKVAVRKDKKQKPRDWITREQWAALHAALPKHMQAMATFAISTGLRQENVLGLEWRRVDLARRHVWVEAEDMKADVPLSVPLSDEALAVLQAQVGIHPTYVFTFRGRRVSEIKTAFIKACVKAKLGTVTIDEDGSKHYEGFTWHGFRHTWATWHVQNGTPLDVLQKLGGWSDLRMVMKYAHHAPGHVAAFANNSGVK